MFLCLRMIRLMLTFCPYRHFGTYLGNRVSRGRKVLYGFRLTALHTSMNQTIGRAAVRQTGQSCTQCPPATKQSLDCIVPRGQRIQLQPAVYALRYTYRQTSCQIFFSTLTLLKFVTRIGQNIGNINHNLLISLIADKSTSKSFSP